MPTKDSEKTHENKATTMAKVVVPTQPVSVGDSDNRYYTCVCKLWYAFRVPSCFDIYLQVFAALRRRENICHTRRLPKFLPSTQAHKLITWNSASAAERSTTLATFATFAASTTKTSSRFKHGISLVAKTNTRHLDWHVDSLAHGVGAFWQGIHGGRFGPGLRDIRCRLDLEGKAYVPLVAMSYGTVSGFF